LKSPSKPNENWYREWFNSPYYHILYRNRDEEEAAGFIRTLIKYLAPKSDSHFLDLACGKGRYSRTINRAGFEVTGVDLSEENIRIAARHGNDRLHFTRHDMREPVAYEKFDFVVNLFTSFGYFKSLEENERVITAISKEVKSKGKVVLDFMNVETVIRGLVPAEERVIEGIKFTIKRNFEEGFIVKTIRVNDGDREHVFHERVKGLSKEDLTGMFIRNGFEIMDIFGNYKLDDFDPETSSRLILIVRKP
jgi:SAM-dependent methyltransferase